MLKRVIYLGVVLLALWPVSVSRAQIIVAGELLVDLKADGLPDGPLSTWANAGTLGNFTAQGTPVVESIDGIRCVTFDGTCWFDGPTSVPTIEGAGDRTIEIWAYNPSDPPIPGEESTVSWAHRGGPEGTNMSFNYGNHNLWGSVGHWGGDTHDMGWWTNHIPCPAADRWWHLVYTYDGTSAQVYVNGLRESIRSPIALNTYGGNIIRVGAQANGDGGWADTAFNFTGSIAEVRIHSGALSAAGITNNFGLGGPRKAYKPNPADGAENVEKFDNYGLLSWNSGLTAAWHYVYFGTNPTPGAGEFKGKQPMSNKFYYPIRTPDTTYYWRIDEEESGGKLYTGDVWSFTTAPLEAHSPSPADGAGFVDPNADLDWGSGFDATSHDVYFGTDETAVSSADKGSSEFKVNQPGTTFEPGTLSAGVTYYWRIDENNSDSTVSPGQVWRFSTRPDIAISDPNLVGWWKLDGAGAAPTVIDWSGYGRHGTLRGNPQYVTGYDGGALKLDGIDDYVDLPIGTLMPSLTSATVTTWVDFANAGGAWQRIFDFGTGTGVYMFLCPRTGTAGGMRFAITTASGGGEDILDTGSTLPSGWHHVAVTINGSSNTITLYLDGAFVGMNASAVNAPSDLGATANNWLGRSQYAADGYLMASLDDFRIYDYALSASEIPETMRGDPALAWNPSPSNGSSVESRELSELAWSPGDFAVQHDVYFGTDSAAVESADTGSSGIYRGRRSATSYPIAGGVEWGRSYYWRIDEINNDTSTSKGRVWSFNVLDYVIVDDFEDYNDYTPDRIFEKWRDGFGYGAAPPSPPPYYPGNGTGSIIGYDTPAFAEQIIVNGGVQSMPYFYFNNLPGKSKYSEATLTLTDMRDWTAEGVKALSLSFRGYPASTGSYSYNTVTQVHTITASGSDIWDVSGRGEGFHDEFHYAYQVLNGAGSITAQVLSVENTDGWAKAGVMIRDTLDANSVHSMVVVTPGNGVSWQYRMTTGGASTNDTQITGITAPHWVKIARETSGTVTASHSADNIAWETMGAPILTSMSTPMYVGLALTSHNATATCEATFGNVTVVGGGGQWGHADIGIISNDAEKMYVAISNSNGVTGVVYHPDDDAILTRTWTEWNVPLTEFSNQGVVLGDVNNISLGFGTRGGVTPGGSGTAYFDDIRLYRGRCFPALARPAGDFSNNCVVDMPDVEIMTNNWLMSDYEVSPTAPSDSGLVARYQLENNVSDTSGNNHGGDPCGAPTYVAGRVGSWAMHFDGTVVGNYVDLGTWNPSAGTGQLGISLWAKWDGLSGYYQGLIAKRDTWNGGEMMWQIEGNVDTGVVGFFREGSYPDNGTQVLPVGEWMHVGVSFDGTESALYFNGEKSGGGAFSFGTDTESRLVFGACEGGGGNPFNGALDEIRIYNRPISQEEMGGLAGRTGTFTQPLHLLLRPQDPAINMNSDHKVDFADYALLADTWLEVVLWP